MCVSAEKRWQLFRTYSQVVTKYLAVFLISVAAYCGKDSLNAPFAYDDEGTIVQNRTIRPETPMKVLWESDYWSQNLTSSDSHKSYRPLTTLTFRWNYSRSQLETYEYHIVNVLIHGVVTCLAFWVLSITFLSNPKKEMQLEDEEENSTVAKLLMMEEEEKEEEEEHKTNLTTSPTISAFKEERNTKEALKKLWLSDTSTNKNDQIMEQNSMNQYAATIEFVENFDSIPFWASIMFGVHAIHAEAVCNTTGRAETLYSFFYLLGLIFYVYSVKNSFKCTIPYLKLDLMLIFNWFLAALMCVCTILSMLCKETGIFLPPMCVLWHFCYLLYVQNNSTRDVYRIQVNWLSFFIRFVLLALFTVVLGLIRLSWNGESPPEFTYKQNPAALNEDNLTRWLSIPWVWCLYLWTLAYPAVLCCDWSGNSISLLTSLSDRRTYLLFTFFACFIFLFFYFIYRLPRLSHSQYFLICSFGLLFLPFLLASNIIRPIGAMKAERLIYLPCLGFCMMFVYFLWIILYKLKFSKAFMIAILAAHYYRLQDRVRDWDDSLYLWERAYENNPVSLHTKYNYSLNLTKHNRFKEAEVHLKAILKEDRDDPASAFLLCLVYVNTNRAPKANKLAKRLLRIKKYNRPAEARMRSNLMTIRALCEDNIIKRAKLHTQSVESDPSNSYAIERAQAYQNFLIEMGVLPKIMPGQI